MTKIFLIALLLTTSTHVFADDNLADRVESLESRVTSLEQHNRGEVSVCKIACYANGGCDIFINGHSVFFGSENKSVNILAQLKARGCLIP